MAPGSRGRRSTSGPPPSERKRRLTKCNTRGLYYKICGQVYLEGGIPPSVVINEYGRRACTRTLLNESHHMTPRNLHEIDKFHSKLASSAWPNTLA
jgi:hypothetical protein